ncbi:winged helix-turn-helix domain-containing protein [Bradyrhizobium sp. SZCCHNS3053]|uniref:winged helix-turn-helix domain-containing protein n=1 Tax=Bradyrhizobium sp. SZCCHNS3053 TaxID=3057322 RepID=UPI002916933B|nr:winged helix-turn-helix domain-containing protein [Bradyrhizobium sp. SZCCHNS3053]
MAEPTLFVTDAEMIRRLGVPEKVARAAIRALDRDRGSGFPPKQRLWGDRRYWPAVRQWFDLRHGLGGRRSTSS